MKKLIFRLFNNNINSKIIKSHLDFDLFLDYEFEFIENKHKVIFKIKSESSIYGFFIIDEKNTLLFYEQWKNFPFCTPKDGGTIFVDFSKTKKLLEILKN